VAQTGGQPTVSPDGKTVAFVAPDKNNVLQVWMKTIGKDDDRVLTADRRRGIRVFRWAEDNRLAPNRAAYGVVAFLVLVVVAFALLVWLL